MKIKKLVFIFLTSLLFTFTFSLPSFAWQITMTNVDGTLEEGEEYTINVYFEGEKTDYLDLLSFAIQWDTSLLEATDYELADYTRGRGLSKYTLWGDSSIPPVFDDIESGRLYDVSSETDLDHMHQFFPVNTNETLMATFTFEALQDGYFENLAGFYYTPQNNLTELVDINGDSYNAQYGELAIFKEGSNSVMAPVPIPAAVWLLGSGVLGLVSIRRRDK
ncbi:MAG: VPLPA-CTERM sorting domain-containing protein [Deltaproteobacteria bacterium]|nr:VPLPA-CTERM sorting domain-containing protein [Deltaproteobacteria bacterium]